MTAPQRKAILGRLMDGAPRIVACHSVGLTRAEFAAQLGKNGALRDVVEETEAAAVAAVENALYKGAMRALEDPRYFRFMAFYLERKAGWVRPALENPHKSVQSVQPANPQPANLKPANLKPANPQLANPGKTVQSVQSFGDGAPASSTPLPVGAQRAAPSPAATPAANPHRTVQSVQFSAPVGAQRVAPTENSHKTVQNVQAQAAYTSTARSAIQNPKSTIQNPVIPNLKSKIQETMAANRARAKTAADR